MNDLPKLVDKAAKTLVVLGSAGFEVAGRHKQVMLALGGDLDKIASLAGVVSTLAIGENRLRVSDTDGDGFVEACEETGVVLAGQRVLILGVGGALREGLGVRYRSRETFKWCLEKANDLAAKAGVIINAIYSEIRKKGLCRCPPER